MITAMISDFKSSEASKKNVQYFQRFHAETWHKSMLRKEILKFDTNSDTFQQVQKKPNLAGGLFSWILIND